MSLHLRLIGNTYNDYTINFPNNYFTLQEIYDNMIEKGIDVNSMNAIKFIINGTTLNNVNQKHELQKDNVNNLYLFSQDKNIRDMLSNKIFTEINQTIQFNKPIVDEVDIISKEKRTIINMKIIEQFKDPDFIKLFQICVTKPYLLGIVNNYISNGDITTEIKMLSDTDEFNYMDEYVQIEELGFNFNNTILLKSIINHFEGSINLIIRYILLKDLKMNEMS